MTEKLPLEKRIPGAEAVRRRAEGRIAAAHVRKDGWPTVDVDDRGLSTRMAGHRYDDPGMIMVFRKGVGRRWK